MKKCFSTLGCTERTLAESLDLCKKYGMQGIEIRGLSGVTDNRRIPELSAENLEETAEKIKAAGIFPAVLGTSCSFHNPAEHGKNLAEGIASAQIAAKIGCPYIRVFGNRALPDLQTATAALTDGLKKLCTAVKDTGTAVLLETHGDFNSSAALRPVLAALEGTEGFGLIWDIVHTENATPGSFEAFLCEFSSYIRHVHIKDRIRLPDGGIKLTLPGEGDLPLVPVLSMLEKSGFDGYVSLEWEKKWHPELPEIEKALEALDKLRAAQEP